jgi:tetratricopeptide (TPR) repeat protein
MTNVEIAQAEVPRNTQAQTISIAALEQRHSCLRSRYRTAILREAEAICDRGLAADQNRPELLHLRGLLAARGAQYSLALACLRRAVSLDTNNCTYLSDLGHLLSRLGETAAATSVYVRAIILAPKCGELYRRLGDVLARRLRLDEAIAMYREALMLDPTSARSHYRLGDVLRAQGRLGEAFLHCERAVELAPTDVEARRQLGRTEFDSGNWKLAIQTFHHALQLQPNRVDLHVDIGETLLRSGLPEDAICSLRRALEISPQDLRACQCLVCAYNALSRTDEGVGAWINLGGALETANRFSEAAAAYQRAISENNTCLEALVRLGAIHIKLAQPRRAIFYFESSLALEPGDHDAHQGLGWALYDVGEFARAWDELDWHHGGNAARVFEQPRWDGSCLKGKTILLWADLSLGDTIQELRYIPRVTAMGGRVIVECHRNLVPVVEQLTCVHHVISRGVPLPDFDVHAPLLALPRIFCVRRDAIPREVPYIFVRQRVKDVWEQRLCRSGDRTVGLVWAGHLNRQAHLRFASLADFRSLSAVNGLRFISLQMGPQERELLAPPIGLRVERLLDETCTIADTAALILNLDLVISVDTMVAHLAGALGAPVWTLLPLARVSRLTHGEGEISAWYPTMRLFRQTRTGEWSDVVERVRLALKARSWGINESISERRAATT